MFQDRSDPESEPEEASDGEQTVHQDAAPDDIPVPTHLYSVPKKKKQTVKTRAKTARTKCDRPSLDVGVLLFGRRHWGVIDALRRRIRDGTWRAEQRRRADVTVDPGS